MSNRYDPYQHLYPQHHWEEQLFCYKMDAILTEKGQNLMLLKYLLIWPCPILPRTLNREHRIFIGLKYGEYWGDRRILSFRYSLNYRKLPDGRKYTWKWKSEGGKEIDCLMFIFLPALVSHTAAIKWKYTNTKNIINFRYGTKSNNTQEMKW